MDRVTSAASCLAGGRFECDIALSRFVVIYLGPLCGDIPWPYVSVRITCGDLVTHPYTYAHPRSRTSE